MIITLEEAKKLNANMAQDDLNALEAMIRNTTHNPFIDTSVRSTGFTVSKGNLLTFNDNVGIKYLRVSDTVILADTTAFDSNGTTINDGLFQVKSLSGNTVELMANGGGDVELFNAYHGSGLLAKVNYPDDVKIGLKKLIDYDVKTAANVGLKSKSVARVTENYLDVNATENLNGYPKALIGFLAKYRKLRW